MKRFIILFSLSYITEVTIRNSEQNKSSARGEKRASGEASGQKKNIYQYSSILSQDTATIPAGFRSSEI
jgi:hypothetical protein